MRDFDMDYVTSGEIRVSCSSRFDLCLNIIVMSKKRCGRYFNLKAEDMCSLYESIITTHCSWNNASDREISELLHHSVY